MSIWLKYSKSSSSWHRRKFGNESVYFISNLTLLLPAIPLQVCQAKKEETEEEEEGRKEKKRKERKQKRKKKKSAVLFVWMAARVKDLSHDQSGYQLPAEVQWYTVIYKTQPWLINVVAFSYKFSSRFWLIRPRELAFKRRNDMCSRNLKNLIPFSTILAVIESLSNNI